MLRDQLFSNPLSLLLGCAAWIPLSIWIIAFVYWMIGGDIEPVTGLIAIICSVGLGGLLMKPPTPVLTTVGFLAIVIITFMFPFVRGALNKRELRSVDIEAIERAYEALHQRPNNPASRIRIARHLHNLGFPAHAIMILASALQDVPTQFFQDEVRLLRMWQGLNLPASEFGPVGCPRCSTKNDPSQTLVCPRCGSDYFADRLRGRFMSNTLGKRLVAIWMIVVSAAIAIGGTPALPNPFNLLTALSAVAVIAFGAVTLVKSSGTTA